MSGAERIIVALDLSSAEAAEQAVDALQDSGCAFKIGLELLYRAGPALIGRFAERGHRIFADAKLHDIPNTVYGAARALAAQGAWLISLHLSGGEAMAAAALEGAEAGAAERGVPRPHLIGITVLTSFDQAGFAAASGTTAPIAEEALRRAENARRWGLDGVVCSVHEARALRRALGDAMLLITPGVRPAFASKQDDQRRTATPGEAIAAGADYLVIGRPVLAASDPPAALQAIAKELADVDERV